MGDVVDSTITMNTSGSQVQPEGVKFTARGNYLFKQANIRTGVTATKAYLKDASLTTLETSDISSDIATFNTALTADQDYYILVDKEGASFTRYYSSGFGCPLTRTNVIFLGGYNEGGLNANYCDDIVSVTTGDLPVTFKINIGDVWKTATVTDVKINIGDVWKSVLTIQINIGDVWKSSV